LKNYCRKDTNYFKIVKGFGSFFLHFVLNYINFGFLLKFSDFNMLKINILIIIIFNGFFSKYATELLHNYLNNCLFETFIYYSTVLFTCHSSLICVLEISPRCAFHIVL